MGSLNSGNSRSCGCWKELRAQAHRRHGGVGQPLYDHVFRGIHSSRRHYRGPGRPRVGVCEEWRDYLRFEEWAIATGYRPGLSLVRHDIEADFSPANCFWTERGHEARQTRRDRPVVVRQGKARTRFPTVAAAARAAGAKSSVVTWALRSGKPVQGFEFRYA